MKTPKQSIPGSVASKVYRRDGNRCRYCGDTEGPFQLDHVYPESKGGATTVDNLVVACRRCNQVKHVKIGIWPKPIGYFRDLEGTEQERRKRDGEIVSLLDRLNREAPLILLAAAAVGIVLVSVYPLWGIQLPDGLEMVGAILLAGGLIGEIAWSAKT